MLILLLVIECMPVAVRTPKSIAMLFIEFKLFCRTGCATPLAGQNLILDGHTPPSPFFGQVFLLHTGEIVQLGLSHAMILNDMESTQREPGAQRV